MLLHALSDEAALLAKRLVERPEFQDKYGLKLDDTNRGGVPIPRNVGESNTVEQGLVCTYYYVGGRLQKYWFILSADPIATSPEDLTPAAEPEIALSDVSSSLSATVEKAYLSIVRHYYSTTVQGSLNKNTHSISSDTFYRAPQ